LPAFEPATQSQPSDHNYPLRGGCCSSDNGFGMAQELLCVHPWQSYHNSLRACLEKLTAVVPLFWGQVKRCFAVVAEANLPLTWALPAFGTA
jgi:hypothetical protein